MAKVTGKAKYAEDFRADGMLFAKLMLSPRPHARVVNIDASRALAMPGVHAILTADDLPPPPAPPGQACTSCRGCWWRCEAGRSGWRRTHRLVLRPRRQRAPVQPAPRERRPPPPPCRPRSRQPQTPPIPAEFCLAKEALYEGEPILAVAADSEELAAAAIEAIRVDFEPLPFVIDPLDGLKPGSPNGRTEGNVFVGGEVKTIKWTAGTLRSTRCR